MNRVTGRVVLKESGAGIPGLVVTVHDVASVADAAVLRTAVVERTASTVTPPRVGSVVTRGDGSFELAYDDPADARRPGLFLVVRAPDRAGDAERPGVLYSSPALREGAGRTEEYLIELGAAELQAAGVPAPAGTASPGLERPESAIHEMGEAVRRHAQVADELRRLTSEQMAAARERTKTVEDELHGRLIEELTGVPAGENERLRMVPPDATRAQIEEASWRTIARNVEETVNTRPPAVGYVQIPTSELDRFKTPDGSLRTDVPAEEIEPYLFGGASDAARPVERVREDPVALTREGAARERTLEEALNAPPEAEPPPPPEAGGNEPSADPEATIESLPRYVGRLVDQLASPEQAVNGNQNGRPTKDDVEFGTDSFSLRGGPADVPAFYDFHNLQIAFDHVWQDAIDEQVIERSKDLAHALLEAGADPLVSVRAGAKPLHALRSELRNLAQARTSAAMPAAMARPAGGIGGIGGIGGHGRPWPPRPPWGPTGPVVVGPGIFEEVEPRQPHELLEELEALLREQYKFEVVAPGTVNFGLDVTYRQRWEPLTYQVGTLVKTITLTPKESRKVSAKRTVKKERSVRELENSLSVRKDESSDTARDEAEIVRKAQGKTSFSLAAKGSFDIGIAEGDSTTTFSKDAATDSSEVKKAFREAVLKAAREYRDERKLEVETKAMDDEETTESTEITNPNDELTVTYLFYELQRRFRVSEHLHRLSPVVLVAMDVPNPSHKSIDRLLLTHSWIVNRVLLDDRYRPALNYLTTRIVGDELALREQLQTVQKLRAIVDGIERNHAELIREVKARNAALTHMMEVRADKVAGEGGEGVGEKTWEWIVGSGDEEDLEAARMREENARESYENAVRAEKELRDSLRSETAALNAATEAYAKAYAEHANRLLEVASLRVHVKANILFYMQAIWSHTYRDQLFFSLQKLKVPVLKTREKRYALAMPERAPAHVTPRPGTTILEVRAGVALDPPAAPQQEFATLAEVADLDRPLGFKGNYMIFPMKRSNALTDFMMIPYVDSELGLHDPDELGSWTPEDFVEYVVSLRKTLPEAEFEALEPELAERYRRIVSAPRRANEEVVVPSDSLYIESLPGSHPNLEDFKLRHRAVDVLKVKAEVRRLELENLRYAARMLSGERGDPEVERKTVIQGDADGVVVGPTDG